MIFPFFHHLPELKKYSVTLILLALNCSLFFVLSPDYLTGQAAMEKLMEDDRFLQAQAQVFAPMIRKHPDHFAVELRSLAADVPHGQSDAAEILGRLSLRSSEFMTQALSFDFQGDRVLHREWVPLFKQLLLSRDAHPNFTLGLSSTSEGALSFLSYQFVHGGAAHLLINMLVLVLIGSVLEPLLGAVGLITVYLLGGMGAGLGFALLSGATPVPLVGASGSVMALFGALLALRAQEPLRFIWILPTSRMAGYVFLPAWILVGYLFLSDLAGLIETAPWIGAGVAHAAHLGGFVSGFLLGLLARPFRRLPPLQTTSVELVPWSR